ncbi:MAG: SDR family oxidoreductase [Dysgonamonadaceae bacterium]|nr:SDR family oxidoreductase [Dysgonamonadaceae bacterium]MDD3356580.1 SDR family oxidoreductase [Dysgonamonadaceae bacterium]MDD4606078.1 SDR family oxidoreductase [Dysgonamonadaceae bacterium]
MNNKTALITGASKGIGKEFARIHASKGDNLVLIARNEELLNSFKKELMEQYKSISVEIIVKDLTKPNSAQEVYKELKEKNIQIDYLINNAGFGDYGFFVDTQWGRYDQMIDLNVKSLTHLCHLFLTDMMNRKDGKILNISSTAAFQPGPMMAVYFATKSYVLHLSEALNNEAKQSNVSVTAFCPGPTDTYFMEDSKMGTSKFIKNRKLPSAHAVALAGYDAMMSAKPVRIYGFMNKLTAFSVRLVPRKWVVSILRKMQE